MDKQLLDRICQHDGSVENYLLLDAVEELLAAAAGRAPMSVGEAYLRVQLILEQRWLPLARELEAQG